VRYREGVLSMLEAYEKGQPFEEDNYIVKEGELASQYS
jgi:formate dehydrogenase